jgi:predicted nucleotidyltransferase
MIEVTASFSRTGSAPDDETLRATRAFLRRLEGRYPVVEGILFGSRARHSHHAGSDADLAVVLKGVPGDRTAAALDMAGIAFEVMLDTGVLVEALPLWDDELKSPELFSNPALIRAIQREGLRLPARQ